MLDQQLDTRRRLLVALALERARTPRSVDGELRRALEADVRARARLARSARPSRDRSSDAA